MTKEELTKIIIDNFLDKKTGKIDLSGLDFGNYSIELTDLKASCINNSRQIAEFAIKNREQKAGRFIYNVSQLAGYIYNNSQKGKRAVFNDCQKALDIHNSYQKAKNIFNDGQKAFEIIDKKQEICELFKDLKSVEDLEEPENTKPN